MELVAKDFNINLDLAKDYSTQVEKLTNNANPDVDDNNYHEKCIKLENI